MQLLQCTCAWFVCLVFYTLSGLLPCVCFYSCLYIVTWRHTGACLDVPNCLLAQRLTDVPCAQAVFDERASASCSQVLRHLVYKFHIFWCLALQGCVTLTEGCLAGAVFCAVQPQLVHSLLCFLCVCCVRSECVCNCDFDEACWYGCLQGWQWPAGMGAVRQCVCGPVNRG